MVFILIVLNAAISVLNAWLCGRSWAETRSQGGVAHFMNWMGAVMSASGFTWSILIILGMVGSAIPVDSADPQHVVYAVSPVMLRTMLELGYVVVFAPIMGSGLAITVGAWMNFLRRPSGLGGAVAAYDTFAMAHNAYEGAQLLPGVLSHLKEAFSGDSELDERAKWLVIGLVVMCLVGGILLTRAIILATARSVAMDRRYARASVGL